MIQAYKSTYLQLADRPIKRTELFCVLEIGLKDQNFTQVIVINQQDLILAIKVKTITSIKGYHRYTPLKTSEPAFGAGGLEKLNTKDTSGMLEGLAKQLQFKYEALAIAFGKGLMALVEQEGEF